HRTSHSGTCREYRNTATLAALGRLRHRPIELVPDSYRALPAPIPAARTGKPANCQVAIRPAPMRPGRGIGVAACQETRGSTKTDSVGQSLDEILPAYGHMTGGCPDRVRTVTASKTAAGWRGIQNQVLHQGAIAEPNIRFAARSAPAV